MEKLRITNFLCIEQAEIEIKKINLFIGEQAQGKSLIAKLIYFFKEYPQSIFDFLYYEGNNKEDFNNTLLMKFEKIFPKYTWIQTDFSIHYSNKYYTVDIYNNIMNNKFFVITNSKNIDSIFFDIPNKKNAMLTSPHNEIRNFSEDIGKYLKNEFIKSLFQKDNCYIEEVIYIPAGRSFFANLQKNIFSLLNSDIQLDFFLKKFGKIYEYIKNNIHITYWDENAKNKVNDIFKNIIGGQFEKNGMQEWIVSKRGKITVANSSSGQQEALPIIIMLTKYSLYFENISKHFIIEEPEAHLFPIAQSQIVALIANAYNEKTMNNGRDLVKFNSFTIATHSPYILTAFNNLIQAGNVAASKNYQNLEELYKVVPESEIVDFNDVSAYLVNNGTVKSILNQELKLIDANMIDEASNYSSEIFRQLISMEEFDD